MNKMALATVKTTTTMMMTTMTKKTFWSGSSACDHLFETLQLELTPDCSKSKKYRTSNYMICLFKLVKVQIGTVQIFYCIQVVTYKRFILALVCRVGLT